MGERGRRWVCVTIVVAAVSACSSGDDDAGPERETAEATSTPSTAPPSTGTTATSTTTATPATTRPPTPEGQITADYLAYWAAYDQLAADPGAADDAVIAEYASGPALDSARQAITDLRAQGKRIELGPREKHNAYAPAVIDAQTGYVADCHVADTRVIGVNGAVERSDPQGGRPETIAVTLVRSGDRWLVDSLQYYDLAPGETCSARPARRTARFLDSSRTPWSGQPEGARPGRSAGVAFANGALCASRTVGASGQGNDRDGTTPGTGRPMGSLDDGGDRPRGDRGHRCLQQRR